TARAALAQIVEQSEGNSLSQFFIPFLNVVEFGLARGRTLFEVDIAVERLKRAEGESAVLTDQFSFVRNDNIAVINHPSGFITEMIREDISALKESRTIEN